MFFSIKWKLPVQFLAVPDEKWPLWECCEEERRGNKRKESGNETRGNETTGWKGVSSTRCVTYSYQGQNDIVWMCSESQGAVTL